MAYFLIQYDRPKGTLLSLREYPEGQRDIAYAERNRLELSKPAHIEVVILEAASEADIRRTHRRYFETLEEIVSSVTPKPAPPA